MLRQSLLTTLAALTLIPAPTFAQTLPAPPPVTAPAASATQPVSTIATLLPKDTTGVLLINTDEARWRDLRKFGLFPDDFSFPGFLYLSEKKVNFNEHVQPWLGDQIGYALLPSQAVVTIASVKNSESIAPYLEVVKASRTKPVKEQQYKGITILEWEPEPEELPADEMETSPDEMETSPEEEQLSQVKALFSKLKQAKPETPDAETEPEEESLESVTKPQPLAIAVLPNFVVSSNSVAAIQQIIDAQEHLSSQPQFQRVLQNSNYGRSLFVAYGNYAEIIKTADQLNQAQSDRLRDQFPGLPTPQLSPDALTALEGFYDTVNLVAWAEQDGLHFQVGVDFKQTVPPEIITQLSTQNEILTQLPEVNYMMTNSQNLAVLWQSIIASLEKQPNFKPSLDQFRSAFQTNLGIDDRDIFPWMTGEYALFMYPTRQGALPQLNFDMGLGLLVQTDDRKTADAAIAKLGEFLKPRLGESSFRERTLAGESVFDLGTMNNGKPINFMSYGWLNSNSFLILGGGGAFSDFNLNPNRNLAQSANFKSAIAPLGDANMGYFYVNFGAVMSLVNNSVLPRLFGEDFAKSPLLDDMKAMLGSIRSISASANILPDRLESRGFMALAVTRDAPTSANDFLKLADEYLVDGDQSTAIENYSRAIELEPGNAIAYASRGSAYFINDNYSATIEDYTQALKLDPKNADYYNIRARAKFAAADYQAALADFEQAIALDATDPSFYSARAEVYLALENYQAAIADADQALNLEQHLREAHSARCYARARGLKDFKGALDDCNQAIGEPEEVESTEYLSRRCYVRANLKDQQALEDCDRASELLGESDPKLLENRGLAKAAIGDRTGALADLQKAANLFEQDSLDRQRIEKALRSLE